MKPDSKRRCHSSGWHDNLSIPLLVTTMLLYGPGAMAADGGRDDAYLKTLEQEVNAPEPAKGSAAAGKSLALSTQANVDPASVKRFERELRDQYRGSYHFYSKLEAEDKLKAYREYEKNQDLSAIPDKVLQLSFAHARRSR